MFEYFSFTPSYYALNGNKTLLLRGQVIYRLLRR
jgi:hypothetical protein